MTRDEVATLREMFLKADRERRHRAVVSIAGWVAGALALYAVLSLVL